MLPATPENLSSLSHSLATARYAVHAPRPAVPATPDFPPTAPVRGPKQSYRKTHEDYRGRGASALGGAARDAGVHQYWHSAVTAIEKDGAMWRVSSADGTVRAACVMICTNAYGGNVWPNLARAYIPVRGYSVISRPISDNLYESILPYNHFITDTRNLWSGIRKLPGNRLHLSTGGSALRADAKANFDEASSRLRDVFPHIGHVDWDGQSSGWVAITPKQLPKILRLADGVFTAFGYSGRGISFATLLGRELAKLPDDRSGDDLLLPVESMRPLPFHGFAPFIAAAWIQWYGLCDRFTLRRAHGTGRRP